VNSKQVTKVPLLNEVIMCCNTYPLFCFVDCLLSFCLLFLCVGGEVDFCCPKVKTIAAFGFGQATRARVMTRLIAFALSALFLNAPARVSRFVWRPKQMKEKSKTDKVV
jgi:hypothetical protein